MGRTPSRKSPPLPPHQSQTRRRNAIRPGFFTPRLQNPSDYISLQRNSDYNNNLRRNMALSANPVIQTNGNLPAPHRRLIDLRDDHRENRQNAFIDLPRPPPHIIDFPNHPIQLDPRAEYMFGQEMRNGRLNNANNVRVYRDPTNLRVNNAYIGQENVPLRNLREVVGPPARRQSGVYSPPPPPGNNYLGGNHHRKKGKKTRRRKSIKR